jgi:hypothetical protein
MVSQGPGTVFDTNSPKTDTVIFRNPRHAVRLAGIGSRRAPKCPQIALFGRRIFSKTGWGTLELVRALLLEENPDFPPTDTDEDFGYRSGECLTTHTYGELQKAWETAVLFRIALSDGDS